MEGHIYRKFALCFQLTFGVTLTYLPGPRFVRELLHDINFGVFIGFNYDRTPLISSNHRSATANPAPVAQELERELSLNRKAEPFLAPTFSNSVWSPIGAIPKKHSQLR